MPSKRLMSYHEYKAKKEEEKKDEKEKCKEKERQKKRIPIEGTGAREKTKSKENDDKVLKEDGVEVEQHITIMPNPAARRGSMANYAFPELHPKTKKSEPENLLVLTTTRTDTRGRRHSVAVPLIPPPDGEKFEGGYHIERNPITGGARLVPPSQPGGSGGSGGSGGFGGGLLAPPSGARSGRRHSIQVTPLSKDLERLRLAEKSPGGSKTGSSKKVDRRAGSKRRSSKQGFLHFLDLAIAS